VVQAHRPANVVVELESFVVAHGTSFAARMRIVPYSTIPQAE
jgi:hypothetical protein